jgi:alpha-amylase
LYTWITSLNKIRTRAISQDANYLNYQAWPVYTDNHVIVMRKGFDNYQIIGIFTNGGSSSSMSVTLSSSQTGFTANQALVDIMSCTTVSTDASGSISLTLSGGLPKVLYPAARLSGSGICPSPGKRLSR